MALVSLAKRHIAPTAQMDTTKSTRQHHRVLWPQMVTTLKTEHHFRLSVLLASMDEVLQKQETSVICVFQASMATKTACQMLEDVKCAHKASTMIKRGK